MKKETEKQFQENISFMYRLRRMIPFIIILLVFIWIISGIIGSKDIGFSSGINLVIYLFFMVLLFLASGWIMWKMDIWFMNKNINIMNKAYENAKKGKKPSTLRVVSSIIFLILALPVLGTFLIWLGVRQDVPMVILLGAGLWAILLYGLFMGVKHYYTNLVTK